MKKTILMAAILGTFLVGCNETKNKEEHLENTEVTETLHDEHIGEIADAHGLDNSWVNEIELDNGNKWDANPETNEGVKKMMDILQNKEKKSVEDFHALASELNEVKNYVVKECTMKGPSHDNLHVFLHPLIEKIDALGKVTTVEKGVEITKSIEDNIRGYYNYFK